MPSGEPDPTVIRSLAVTASDVLDAYEARRQRGADVVLRVTPPFSGRMRARLHVADATRETDALHVEPGAFLADDAPSYPRPAETADRLRADPDETYSVERHHDRHATAIEQWRERAERSFAEETTVDTPEGPVEVSVVVLDPS